MFRAFTTSCYFPLVLQQASRLLSASSSTTILTPVSHLSARVEAGDFGPSADTLEIAIRQQNDTGIYRLPHPQGRWLLSWPAMITAEIAAAL
jgi:hypothetical protein